MSQYLMIGDSGNIIDESPLQNDFRPDGVIKRLTPIVEE